MKIRKPIIVLLMLLLISTTLVGAYISVSGINLPDGTVTLNAEYGSTSYFDITLSGVPAGHDVTNGVYAGWCSDFGIHMDFENPVVVRLYDSYGSLPTRAQDTEWDEVNWILNHKGSYSMMDIQRAIWHLLNEVDISAYVNAQNLANDADTYGNGFTYKAGDIIAIVCVPERADVQCSFIELTLSPGNEGLTPGFWKNHLSAWHSYTPSQTVGSVFTIPSSMNTLSDDTLLEALQYKGGNTDIAAARILLRSAVAALLNAAHPEIDYPLSPSTIISDVNSALSNHDRDTMLDLKDVLDGYNNLGADL